MNKLLTGLTMILAVSGYRFVLNFVGCSFIALNLGAFYKKVGIFNFQHF